MRKLTESGVAHETAHQWFGDAVTVADWHHLWLSEGFATYLSALWTSHVDSDSGFRAVMRKSANEVFESPAAQQPIVDTTASDLIGLLNSNNYQKGAWVLHQLHGLVGDSAFYQGLRRYYTVYRDSTALSSDFARVMSEAAARDLEWYFRQALIQPGSPALDIRWKHQGDRLALVITQTQKPEWGTYRIPNLEIWVDGKPLRMDLEGRETGETFHGVRRPPRKVEIDPNGWWLLKATVRGEK